MNQDNPEYDDTRMNRLLVTFGLQYACILALLLLNLFSDKKAKVYDPELEKLEKPCPRLRASFFSKLYFIWADRLLWTGYRNPLKPENLWDPQPHLTSRGTSI